MLGRTDSRTLIDRGRKAGLGTAEMYRALAARRPDVGNALQEQADGNGYVAGFGKNGQRVYRPFGGRGRI